MLQCLVDDDFAGSNQCIFNPVNCDDGLSVSLFYKLEFDVDPNDLQSNKVGLHMSNVSTAT